MLDGQARGENCVKETGRKGRSRQIQIDRSSALHPCEKSHGLVTMLGALHLSNIHGIPLKTSTEACRIVYDIPVDCF